MHITEGLEHFINNALLKSKRDRILGFLVNEKNHKKFYSALDHDFEKCIDTKKIIKKLTESELNQVGNLYCSNGVTDNSETPMVNLYGKAPWEGGWLLINKTGTLGIYRPEGRIDDEIHIKL